MADGLHIAVVLEEVGELHDLAGGFVNMVVAVISVAAAAALPDLHLQGKPGVGVGDDFVAHLQGGVAFVPQVGGVGLKLGDQGAGERFHILIDGVDGFVVDWIVALAFHGGDLYHGMVVLCVLGVGAEGHNLYQRPHQRQCLEGVGGLGAEIGQGDENGQAGSHGRAEVPQHLSVPSALLGQVGQSVIDAGGRPGGQGCVFLARHTF